MYTKFHDHWTSADLLTATALNHLETQFAEIKAIIDVHNHDSDYYTKATSDVTFFSLTFTEGFDADSLDGYHYSDLLAAVLPLGSIIWWPGTEANVPAGWHICDGAGSTPDLRDRFIIGSGLSYSIGDTGGVTTRTPTASLSIGGHAITTGEMPAHAHVYKDYYHNREIVYCSSLTGSSPVGNLVLKSPTPTTGSAGGGGAHGHTGGSITLNSVTTMPPYYALYLIKKVA